MFASALFAWTRGGGWNLDFAYLWAETGLCGFYGAAFWAWLEPLREEIGFILRAPSLLTSKLPARIFVSCWRCEVTVMIF